MNTQPTQRRRMQPQPPIPPDILAAIASPPTEREWPSEQEMGFRQKIRARAAVDVGEIRTHADVDERTRTYALWFESMSGILAEETLAHWMSYELQFAASAHKYLAEIGRGTRDK